MTKPEIEFKKEPLRCVCNHLFYGFKSIDPNLYCSEKYDKHLAFGLGALGSIGAAELGKHYVFPNIVEPIAKALGSSVSLEEVISIGIIFTLGAVVMPPFIALKETKEWIKEHGTFASGVAGIGLAALATAVYELS